MIKLLRSNLKRILSSKTFWICSAAYILFGLILSLVFWTTGSSLDFPSLNTGLSGGPLTVVIMLIILSVIIGSDFKNNTIRNKIIIGHSKTKIYLSNVLAFSICAIALNLVYLCVTFPISPYMLVTYVIDAIFHENSIARIAQTVVMTVFYNIFTVTFIVSVYMLIIMNVKNTVVALICSIALNAVALITTSLIYYSNTYWVNVWLSGILYFYPTGINALIANGDVVLNSLDHPILILPITAIMVILTVVSTTVGAAIFKKSDIK